MSNIGSVSALVALIAQEVNARRRSKLEREQPAGGHPSSQSSHASQKEESQLGLQQRIVQRASAIDPSDPDRDSKGLKVLLEAVLLEAFGDELVEDPAFHELLARVHSSMVRSEALADPIRKAMAELLGGQSPGD